MTDTATIIDMRGIFKREQTANGYYPMGLPSLPPEGPTAARAAAKRALNAQLLVVTEAQKADLERLDAEMLLRTFRLEATMIVKKMTAINMGAEAVRLFQAIADETRDLVNEGNANA